MMMWDAAIYGNPGEFLVAEKLGGGGGVVGAVAGAVLIEEMFDDNGDDW